MTSYKIFVKILKMIVRGDECKKLEDMFKAESKRSNEFNNSINGTRVMIIINRMQYDISGARKEALELLKSLKEYQSECFVLRK